jgi:hypothetical protein
MRELTPNEARVLGVLVEKAATVPDTYPLSLNALVAGCNQKTARDPVLELGNAEVQEALDGLKSQSLVFESSGGRVTRYEHNAARGIGVPTEAAALLAVLMLRGPQTAAELRSNAERLHRFADNAAVEACLSDLADRYPPRAVKLARAPGARESRWAHGLSGEIDPALIAAASAPGAAASDADPINVGEYVSLRAEVTRQAAQIERLTAVVQRLASELGVAVPELEQEQADAEAGSGESAEAGTSMPASDAAA